MAAVAGIRSCSATLTAATVDTVTLSAGINKLVEITHHGDATDLIWFRTDGVDPVAAADENDVVLPSERVTVNLGDDGELRVISAGIPTYTVSVLN